MDDIDPELKAYILNAVKKQYVERRDNPLDILPHSVEPTEFYSKEYEKYKIEIERLKKLTDEEAKKEEIAYRKKQIDDYKKYVEAEKQKIENLKGLLVNIQNWNCPVSLAELKNIMVEKINTDIISHERCANYISYIDIEINGKQFKKQMIVRYEGMMDGYLKNMKREQAWADETNKLLKDLKDNLGDW